MSKFLEAVNDVSTPSVDIKIGNEEFQWLINGQSLVRARQEGVQVFDVFAELSESKEGKITMSMEAMYDFLWMGLSHIEDASREEIQKLPIGILKNLPMQEMMKSLASQDLLDEGDTSKNT